jgi:hypothetical protein
MLFDEPTSALDPIATASIEELISELREKVTILIVTHNMQQAARISDFTAYMYLGEMVEFGVTDQIFIKPQPRRTDRGLHHRKVRVGLAQAHHLQPGAAGGFAGAGSGPSGDSDSRKATRSLLSPSLRCSGWRMRSPSACSRSSSSSE